MEKIIIDKKFVQIEAGNVSNRKLKAKEYEEVYETILESLPELIQDSIHKVINFNELLERNKGACQILPHYKVYHRNENAYQPKFRVLGKFITKVDAMEFLKRDYITEFDEWRLVIVKEDATEQEIYKINC